MLNMDDPGIKIREKVICTNCNKEIKFDDKLGYYCNECGCLIKIISS